MEKRGINAQEMIEKEGILNTLKKAREVARDYVYNLREHGRISFSDMIEGDSPSIHIVRRTLPEVWEDITMALLGIGKDVHTYYDPKDKKGEWTSFPSMEGTVMMHIEEPFGEPRFHKHFLGGYASLGDYRAEIEGVKDHWMIAPDIVVDMIKRGKFDEIADDERWKYTYHQILSSYPFIDIEAQPKTINQLQSVVDKLEREPLSKSAQAVTWDARWDHNDGQLGVKWKDYDSPCLQRFWFRLIPFEKGYKMGVNGHWRSRCHLKAVPQNIYGVSEGIFEPTRAAVEERLKVPIVMGRYVDINDSLHLYGHYFDDRQQGLDAQAYLQDIFRVAEGEPLKERLVIPGTDMHDIYLEEIAKEYKFRKENPDAGRER